MWLEAPNSLSGQHLALTRVEKGSEELRLTVQGLKQGTNPEEGTQGTLVPSTMTHLTDRRQ